MLRSVGVRRKVSRRARQKQSSCEAGEAAEIGELTWLLLRLIAPVVLLLPAEQALELLVTQQRLELTELLLHRHFRIEPLQQFRGRQIGRYVVGGDIHHLEAEAVFLYTKARRFSEIAAVDITPCDALAQRRVLVPRRELRIVFRIQH